MSGFNSNSSGMMNLSTFRIEDYALEGPIGGSTSTFLATSKMNEEDKKIIKKMIFTTSAERQACINSIQQTLSSQTKGINLPRAYAVEYIDEKQNVLSLLYQKNGRSLKDEIEKRQRSGLSYFSTQELKSIVEYSFEQLFKLSTEKLYHLNIKPSNLLQDIRNDYNLSEGGYPSVNQSLDNDVFRSPELISFLAKKKPIIQLSTYDMEAADIFSLGLAFVQAATLLPVKDLKAFNDEKGFPQEAKDVLETIQTRYGRDCYQLLSLMVSFEDAKRSKLENIKNNELKNFINSRDKPFNGGTEASSAFGRNGNNTQQIAPEDLAFCRKIKLKCQDYCDRQRIILQEFFTNSDGYDRITKTITKYEFRRLLQTAGVTLEEYELNSLNKALDPSDDGKYSLSDFFQESNAMNASTLLLSRIVKDDLPQLLSQEDEVMLQAALKRANAFIKRERVQLERFLKEEDRQGSGLLTFQQFKRILDVNGIVFREQDFNNIKIKFDLNFKKETINYMKFLEALNKTVTISDIELREWQDSILKSIMRNFKSLDDFLIKQSRDNQSFMSCIAFSSYLEQDGIKVPENVLLKIKEILDPQDTNQIYVRSLKSFLQQSLEQEVIKRLVQDLANSLENYNMSFSGFINNYLSRSSSSKTTVFIEKCQDALKLRLDRRDFSFALEYFDIEQNFSEEFQINRLSDSLSSFAKSNRINNAQKIFGDENMSTSTNQFSNVRVSSQPISAGGTGQLQGSMKWSEIEKHSRFCIEINRLLTERNRQAKDHFYSSDKIVSREFIEQRLNELGLKVADFERELDMIILQIGERLNQVEISKFIDVIDHFSSIAATKKNLIENKSSIVWFIKIYKTINDNSNLSISLFNRLIVGSDRINAEDFTEKITRDLHLVTDESYKTFMEAISLPNGDVSFLKFQEGYLKEEQAQKTLADMRNMTKSSNKTISQAFSNIDTNGDGLISKSEFLEMMPIINQNLKKDDLSYLYERLDLNNSGSISLDEFRDNILGRDALQSQQDLEVTSKQFYREIQDCLHRERKTFEDVFMDSREKQMTTSELEKILHNIGFRLEGSKEKMLQMFEDLSFGGVIFNRMRLKTKYLKYSDQTREGQMARSNQPSSGQDKSQAYELTKTIKQGIQSQKLYFDDVFSSRRGYKKSEVSDLLYDKLNINTQRYYQQQFESFWEYFRDRQTQELDMKLFEQVFKELRVEERDSRSDGGNGRDNRRDSRDQQVGVAEMLERFLTENAQNCERQLGRIHSQSVTIGELLDCIEQAGFRQSITKREAEDYIISKDALNRNGEVDYPRLFETLKRSKRFDQRDNDKRDNYGDRNDGYNRDRRDSRDRNLRDSRFRDNDNQENDRNFNNNNSNRRINDSRGQQQQPRFDKRDYNAALKELLDSMVEKQANILDIVKTGRLDRNNEGLADNKEFWEEMRVAGVRLSNNSRDIIEEFKVSSRGFIEYKKLDGDIRDLLEEQKKNQPNNSNNTVNQSKRVRKHKKIRMKKDEIQGILSEFKQDIQKYIKDKSVGIRYAFKRFDKDNDGTISFVEFENALNDSRLLPFFEEYQNREDKDSIIENLFDIFDEDKELKIDLLHFQKIVYPEQSDIDIAPLMMQFKSLLKSTSEEDLRTSYKLIDSDQDGQISYSEFQKYIKQITKGTPMKDVEIERLFQHFLQDKSSDKISFEHFVAVVQDDHMNFEKIRKKIIEYREKNSITLKSIYDKHAGANGTISLQSLQMFFQVLKLEFSMDQLDELFSFLDTNGDGMISYDEFYNAIEKAEINYFQLLKRMRREFVNSKCDVPTELKNKANGRDTVFFSDFKGIITQFKVEVKPFELDALYKKYGKDDMIYYMNFLNDLLFNKCDIETIKKKVLDYTTKENISLSSFFGFFSHNKDAIILPEFQQLLLTCEANIPKDEVLEAFSAFDTNNNGSIQKNEFIAILQGQVIPQASIGYQFMLQNAQNFQPMNYYMDQSVMLTSTNPFANLSSDSPMNASSQFAQNKPQGQFGQFQQATQSQFQAQQLILPSEQLQQYGQPQLAVLPNPLLPGNNMQQGEINLPVSCTVEEIIDTIGQECAKRRIRVFYLFVVIDQESFKCVYEKEEGLELILKELRINAKGTHYEKLFKRFYVQDKKGLGYMNILKEILVGKGARQLSVQTFQGYITSVLGILLDQTTSAEIQEIYKSMVEQKTQQVGIQEVAGFLSVTIAYNGAFDKIDYIDVKNSELGLRKIEDVCKSLHTSAIDLFSYFDKKNLYKFKLENFEELLESLDLRLSSGEVRSIQQQYSAEEDIQILPLVSMIEQPSEIFKKICVKVMACNGLAFEEFFTHFSADGKFSKWRNQELKKLFFQFNLFPSERELLDLFVLIAQKKNDIYPQDLAAFIGVALDTTSVQAKQLQDNITSNIRQLLLDYRNNRPALLARIAQSQLTNNNTLQLPGQINRQNPSNNQILANNTNNNSNFSRNDMFSGNLIKVTETVPFISSQPPTQKQFEQRTSFSIPLDQQQQFGQLVDQRGYSQSIVSYTNEKPGLTHSIIQPPELQTSSQQKISSQDRTYIDKQIFDGQLKKLSLALEKYGGQEILNLSDKNGQIHFNQLEQVLLRSYGFSQSPDFNILLDNLVDKSGYAIIQDVFKRADYDHQRYLKGQDINRQLGVGIGQSNNNNRKPKVVRDERKIRDIRKQLLAIYNQDFAQLSETFFLKSPFLNLESFCSIAKTILNGKTTNQLGQGNSDDDLEGLFDAIDVNNNGSVTYNEFEQFFVDDPQMLIQRNQQKSNVISAQTEKDIQELFNVVDTSGDKQISIDELNVLFAKIGGQVSQTEIDEYMKRYDKNGDKTLSFEEFKLIMEEKLKNEMMTSDTVINDLKREFKKVDMNNKRMLNIGQLGQVFNNLGVLLKPAELSALFNEIDVDGSRTVDIDELVAFISRNQEGSSSLAQTAALNIRQSRKFSIRDLLDTFKQMPANYRLSFFRSQLQKRNNLPSSTLKPRLSSSLTYPDLYYDNTTLLDPNVSVLDHKREPSQFLMELQFKLGQGIPLPDEASFPRDSIVKRVAYVSFYDANKSTFIGNTCRLVASWTSEYEDRWTFENKSLDQIILARYVGYDKSRQSSLSICVELVMHYLPKNSNSKTDLEISVSHVLIPLNTLNKNGEMSFNLSGGEPSNPVFINPEDVRTKRTGFKTIVKALSKKIDSSLIISVSTKVDNRQTLSDIAIMPEIIILRKNCLPFYSIYREYFGFRSICKKEIDVDLPCDPIFKTFLKSIDCPDTHGALSDFWRLEVLGKIQNLNDLKTAFVKTMNHIHQVFSYEKFMFNQQDPTGSVNCFSNVLQDRRRLISLCLEDLRIVIGLKTGTASNLKISENSVPFSIDELLDDNEEDDNLMMEEFIKRKHKSGFLHAK